MLKELRHFNAFRLIIYLKKHYQLSSITILNKKDKNSKYAPKSKLLTIAIWYLGNYLILSIYKYNESV